jgi:hypothetical protein
MINSYQIPNDQRFYLGNTKCINAHPTYQIPNKPLVNVGGLTVRDKFSLSLSNSHNPAKKADFD